MEFKKLASGFLGITAIKKNLALMRGDIKSLRAAKQAPADEVPAFDALIAESGVTEQSIRRQYRWRYVAAWLFLFLMIAGLSLAFFSGYEKSGLILFLLTSPLYFQHMFIMAIIREKKQLGVIAFFKITLKKALFLPRPLPHGWQLFDSEDVF